MIDFENILDATNVRFVQGCKSRKSALQTAANLLSSGTSQLLSRELLEELTAREELGCTALEDTGVAIPHCRNAKCTVPVAALLRMIPDVQFGADERVKLILALVVPKEEDVTHLEILQTVARVCNKTSNIDGLLNTKTPEELYRSFIRMTRMSAAA